MRPDQPQLAISNCLLQQRWLSAKQFPSPSCSRCPKTLLSEIVGLTKPTLSYEVPFRNRQPCGILSTSLASSCSVDSSWRSRADRPCLDAQTSAPQEPVLAAGESLILPQYLVPSTVSPASCKCRKRLGCLVVSQNLELGIGLVNALNSDV